MNRAFLPILFLGIFFGSPKWIIIAIGCYILFYAYEWWLKRIKAAFETQIDFEPSKMHVDQEGIMRIRLKNNSILPMHVIVSFDADTPIEVKQAYKASDSRRVKNTYLVHFLLPPKSSAEKQLNVVVEHRGLYWLDNVHLKVRDPLGLTHSELELQVLPQLMVFPKPFLVQEMAKIMHEPMGDVLSQERLLQEDQAFYIGSRNYQMGDPFKKLDWKATARRQSLQTKLYDYTVHGKVYFVMDPPNLLNVDDEKKAVLEKWIGSLATLISFCRNQGIVYRVLINSSFRVSKKFSETPWGSNHKHYQSILELLARLKVNKWIPFSVLLHQIEREGHLGSGVVVLKQEWKEEDRLALQRLERKGYRIWIVQLSDHGSALKPLANVGGREENADADGRYIS